MFFIHPGISYMRRDKLLSAAVVCFCLFLAGCLLLAWGCAVRHLPGGGTAPATTFEQVLAWNAALAQANDGLADNIIALQRTGIVEMEYAKSILLRQAAIAKADQQITAQIKAAADCAKQQLGANAVPSELDAAAAACAQVSAPALAFEVDTITKLLVAMNSDGLTGIKDPAKRDAINGLLVTIGGLISNIASSLTRAGVVTPPSSGTSPTPTFASVLAWEVL